MKVGHVVALIAALLVVGGVLYYVTRPTVPSSSGGGGLLSEGDGAGGDRTARDVAAVTSGVGSGLGSLFSGIADLVRASQRPPGNTQQTTQASEDALRALN